MNKNNYLRPFSSGRRSLTLATCAALAAPRIAFAQAPQKIARIGFLAQRARPASIEADDFGGFARGMHEQGLIEGKHYVMEWRFADGSTERLAANAAELVALKVDVIVAAGTPAALAAGKATSSIPVVMGSVAEPVTSGLVKSLGRPGGNVTGLSNFGIDLSGKLLEMLKSFSPKLTRVAVLVNPSNPSNSVFLKGIQEAGPTLKVEVVPVQARTLQDIERAFAGFAKGRVGGLVISGDGLFMQHQKQLAELTQKHRLPAIGLRRVLVESGLLISYGPNNADIYRHAAVYVGKILKGVKPADLPVEQPMRVELFINGRTAKALGLTIPKELMVLAAKVIE